MKRIAYLMVDTSDRKRHVYPVAFDPLVSGKHIEFYIVNVCSSGIVPTMAQWTDTAEVRVIGAADKQRVPLKFEKRNWPSSLMILGASSFLWNGVGSCQGW